MVGRPTYEEMLISSLILTQSPDAARYGVTPEMLVSCQSEYAFISDYHRRYEKAPTLEVFVARFPHFNYVQTQETPFYADEVRHEHHKRQANKAVQEGAVLLRDNDLAGALDLLTNLSMPMPRLDMLDPTALYDMSLLDRYEEPINGLQVGAPALRAATGGFNGGDVVYLAARMSQGKSWILTDMAADALMQGKNVAFFSLEMPNRQVVTRMHVSLARRLGIRVTHHELRFRTFDAHLYKKLLERIAQEVPGNFFPFDFAKGAITPNSIAGRADGMDLLMVDYVGLLHSDSGSRAVEDHRIAATNSNTIKEIAVRHDVPVVSAAQLNREGDTPGWRPPSMKTLSDTDVYGRDADVVVTMKRPSKSTMCYSLEKNRSGEAGFYWWSMFEPNVGDFREIKKEQADDIKDNEAE